jgi:hypothetical protein
MAIATTVEQVVGSYNFTYSFLDDTNNEAPLKVEIYEQSGTEPITVISDLLQDTTYPYTNELGPGTYRVEYYLLDPAPVDPLNPWVYKFDEPILIQEYQINVDWNWTSGGLEDPNGNVIVSGIANNGDGFIVDIEGWGNPTGTQWSDLNGTYVKTSVAVTPSGISGGDDGMHTPKPGTFNYYLAPVGNPAFNGIAYFLAPGNRSGWGDPDNDATTDPSVNYWRLCVLSDYPYCYFTNPSTDPTVFPTTGWIVIDDTLSNSEGGNGYDYIAGYDGGFTVNFTSTILDPETTYSYYPASLILNNNACPTVGGYTPSISHTLYHLINGLWVDINTETYSLVEWDDIDQLVETINLEFIPEGYPIKIETTLRNCHQEIIHSTLNDPGIFLLADSQTTHSETQDPASYTIRFAFEYLDITEPNLIITPENNVRAEAYIYKNNEIIFIYNNVLPGLFYPYTFSEASSEDVEYKVVYKAINPDLNLEESLEVLFIVKEYKPTFDLPTISCLQINENASILLQNLNFNCFNNDENLHILPSNVNLNIRYSLYYFNTNTYVWELQGSVSDTPDLNDDAIDYADENPAENDLFISEYLREKYYYGSLNTEKGLWKPEKLTMVKLVAAVTNYTTTVTKEVVFPICGSWKIRRMSCGKYRIYNYKNEVLTFTISNYNSTGVLKTVTIVPLSFEEITFDVDGIYKVSSDNLHRYIINFCEIENCVLELQKKVLLDDHLCDTCKLDKVLYQKALRLIPIYETWKKLLDKDWVYEIQYKSTDIDGVLAAIYDANELYAELKLLCDGCADQAGTKKCNC